MVVSILWTEAKVFSIMLQLACDRVNYLKLQYNLLVCGTPNLIELCYLSAYKEHLVHSSIGVYI